MWSTGIEMNKELIDVITEQDTHKRTNSLFKIAETQEGISKKGEKFDYSKDNNDDWLEEISKNEKIKTRHRDQKAIRVKDQNIQK